MRIQRFLAFRSYLAFSSLAIAALAAASSQAAEIKLEAKRSEVETAVRAWLAQRAPAPGRGRQLAGLREFRRNGSAVAWAADLDGGGTVVLSASRAHAPIVAFSPSRTLSLEDGSPLASLLAADAALPQPTAAASLWSPLLSGAAAVSGRVDSDSMLDDVRVAPLVSTKWGQSEVTYIAPVESDDDGEDGGESSDEVESEFEAATVSVYNSATPGNRPSGCVATALAQFMYNQRWPVAAIPAFSEECTVDAGVKMEDSWAAKRFPADESLSSWTFDWAAMAEDPSTAFSEWAAAGESTKIDDAIRQLGQLLYACGVSVHMTWGDEASGSYTIDVASALEKHFGYASAKALALDTTKGSASIDGDTLIRVIGSNLDYGLPVQLGINDESGTSGHSILCDGYGFIGEGDSAKPCFHLNMGWDGQDDVWYALPSIKATGYDFTVVNAVIYNAFREDEDGRPASGDDIVSGRVVDDSGAPVSGADVIVTSLDGSFSTTAVTSDSGVFAARVPGGAQYAIEGISALSHAYATNDVPHATSAEFAYKAYEVKTPGVAGNTWGVELVVSSEGAGTFEQVAEAVNAPDIEFSWEGDVAWFGQSVVSADGRHAAQSGAVEDGGVSTMSATVTVEEDTAASFVWKSATEAGADHLRFFLDGEETARISGDTDWTPVEFMLVAGEHSLSWQYAKDDSLSKADDAVWVDKFTLGESDRTDFQIWMVDTWGLATDSDYIAKASEDADGDGLSNVREYVAGTNPTDPDDRLVVTRIDKGDGTAEIEWSPSGKAGRTYTIESSPTIGEDASWSSAATGVSSPWTDTEAGTDAKFYRVKVEMPVAGVD